MRDRLAVLVLASNPFQDGAGARLDEEVRALERALRSGGRGERVRVVSHFATRAGDLREALLRHDPQVVHLAGSGDAPGILCLADAQGTPRRVEMDALRDLFGALSPWISVMMVNGPGARSTVEALDGAVDYVVGMDRPLADPAAVAFAGAFYGALGMGSTVRAAFERAASPLSAADDGGAAASVLRIRPGIDPAVPLIAEDSIRSPQSRRTRAG